jgi:hypothetical protein
MLNLDIAPRILQEGYPASLTRRALLLAVTTPNAFSSFLVSNGPLSSSHLTWILVISSANIFCQNLARYAALGLPNPD